MSEMNIKQEGLRQICSLFHQCKKNANKLQQGASLALRNCALAVLFVWACLGLSAQENAGEADAGQQVTPPAVVEEQIPVNLDEAAPEGENAVAATGALGPGLYIRVISILLLIILMIYVTIRFLRRLALPNAGGENSALQVLASKNLHADRMLHLVEVGGEVYFLGTGSSGVQLIDKIDDEDAKNRILLANSEKASAGNSFLKLLSGRMQAGPENNKRETGGGASPIEEQLVSSDFLQRQSQRLREALKGKS